jgi:hypothetical protein
MVAGFASLLDNVLALRHDMRCAGRFSARVESLARKTSISHQTGGVAA